jgi:D-sedoheptulose 7-phosphate isomerase
MNNKIKSILKDSINTKESILKDKEAIISIEKIVEACFKTISNNGYIFFCGNGGSAADAQHLAAELTGKFKTDRKPLKGIVLGSNLSSITAIGNDYSFEDVFSRELEGLGSSNDLLICYSTSGNSKNIISALKSANKLDIMSVLFSGDTGGDAKKYADISICIPSNVTARIQESHITLSHIVFEIFEELFLNA